MVLQSGAVIVGGDINIHVDDVADADAARLDALFDAFDLQQHDVDATHNLGGTLDIVATFSDHSLITCCQPAHHSSSPRLTRVVHSWRRVDQLKFVQVVKDSAIGCLPSLSQSVDELFMMYDNALRDIADRLTPAHMIHSRVQPLAPWFDLECQ